MVYGGRMTKQSILEAQDYLRVKTEDGFKRIVDIHSLLRRHDCNEALSILKDYLRQKEHSLRSMILIDKTNRKVDELVASMFRLSMAIKAIEDGEEVMTIERAQPGAKEGGNFHKRDSGGHIRPGIRKNPGHDGKDREPGQEAQCAA